MKKLSLYIFLVLMFCNTAQALPECEGEDDTQWTNCFGTYLKKDLGNGVTRDYSGEFGNTPGKREGKGKSKVYKDGNPVVEYVGEFKNDRSHGQGTDTSPDGNKYVGEFKNGIVHGQGTYTWANGDKYVGEWKDGKKHGQGTFTNSNGEKYVGGHKNDKKHGQGTYIFPDGAKYVGEFKNGKLHGQVTYTSPDGRVEKGIWKDGELAEVVELAEAVELAEVVEEAGDDLNGKKLYCFQTQSSGSESEAALAFIENNYVKFGHMNSYPNTKIIYMPSLILVTNYQYKVTENKIIIGKIGEELNYKSTTLNRKTLSLSGGEGSSSFRFYDTCKLVDYDPIKKFEKKYIKRKPVIKKEEKNKI